MNPDSKPSGTAQDALTIELYWRSQIPHIEPPAPVFLRDWLRWYTLEQIFAAIEKQSFHLKFQNSAEAAGRIVSSYLRRHHGSTPREDSVRALHFDIT